MFAKLIRYQIVEHVRGFGVQLVGCAIDAIEILGAGMRLA